MSEDAGQGASADVLRKELDDARERMEVLRAEATEDVNKKWGANHKPKELIDLKVNGRLASNDEFRKLRDRVKELEAELPD